MIETSSSAWAAALATMPSILATCLRDWLATMVTQTHSAIASDWISHMWLEKSRYLNKFLNVFPFIQVTHCSLFAASTSSCGAITGGHVEGATRWADSGGVALAEAMRSQTCALQSLWAKRGREHGPEHCDFSKHPGHIPRGQSFEAPKSDRIHGITVLAEFHWRFGGGTRGRARDLGSDDQFGQQVPPGSHRSPWQHWCIWHPPGWYGVDNWNPSHPSGDRQFHGGSAVRVTRSQTYRSGCKASLRSWFRWSLDAGYEIGREAGPAVFGAMLPCDHEVGSAVCRYQEMAVGGRFPRWNAGVWSVDRRPSFGAWWAQCLHPLALTWCHAWWCGAGSQGASYPGWSTPGPFGVPWLSGCSSGVLQ